MNDQCKQYRDNYRLPVLACLSVKPLITKELYKAVQQSYPILCDDAVRCLIRPTQTRWQHSMRWAQQDLKKERLIYQIKHYDLWKITETGADIAGGEAPKIEYDDSWLDAGGDEGWLQIKSSPSYVRDRKLRKQAIERALRLYRKLGCEVCGFVFEECYGSLGRGFIEVHHRTPISQILEGTITTVDDLALVCSNCHSMLNKDAALTVEALRNILVVDTI